MTKQERNINKNALKALKNNVDQDLKIKQIAEREGRTPMSVYKVLHRARMALADCVKETLETEEARA